MDVPSLEEFLSDTNGRCRERVFDSFSYDVFREHVKRAKRAAKKCQPYYWETDAGGVPNSYRYATTTARCGVFTTPAGGVTIVFERSKCYGRGGAPCVFHGGERSYEKWFKENKDGSEETED